MCMCTFTCLIPSSTFFLFPASIFVLRDNVQETRLPPPPPCEQCLPFYLPLGGGAAGCHVVGWSPSAVWDAEEWRRACLVQLLHGCAKFQCVGARRRGT